MKDRTLRNFYIYLFLSFFFLTSCEKKDSILVNERLTDIDSNSYKTVTIGSQLWMAENLKTTKYNDGSEITDYYCYNNDSFVSKEIYGVLYSINSVKKGNICPAGWHVSTQHDWEVLSDTLGGISIAGSELKEGGLAHWNIPNADATNESGFTALPGGCLIGYWTWTQSTRERIYHSDFRSLGDSGYWWADTTVCSLSSSFSTLELNKTIGIRIRLSIRCVKD